MKEEKAVKPDTIASQPRLKTGTLYGIGVGPGDPELIPIKSVRILERVDGVFAAASTKNTYSLAITIAKQYIRETTPATLLHFPMSKDQDILKKAWQEHADVIIQQLNEGKDIAFLTLGDPLTYSTYGYVLKNVRQKAPDVSIETIPGITSYHAAAARLNTPLVEGEESLTIMSGVNGGSHLRKLTKYDNVVILKSYRNTKDIVSALEEAKMIQSSVGISNCGLPDEEIMTDIRKMSDRSPCYMTLIIAKHSNGLK